MAEDDSEFRMVVGRLLKSIDDIEATLSEKKRLVNALCAEYDRPAHFADVSGPKSRTSGALKRDQFYGKPLATAIREFLEMRGASDRGGSGAASVNEIFSALMEGGFKFDTKNEANAKRGLRIALSKNTVTFHRVGENYGLLEWYPNARPTKPATKIVAGAQDMGTEEEEEENEEEETDDLTTEGASSSN